MVLLNIMVKSKINNIPVMVPVFNHGVTIKQMVNNISQYFQHIIIIDDGSTVPVNTIINDKNITILRHSRNLGKGKAILTGLNFIKKSGFDKVITIDADGQHFIEDILPYIDIISNSKNTIFIGNRIMNGKNIPEISKFGRLFSNFWIYVETFKKIRDSQCGFRVYPISVLSLNCSRERFDFEVEVLVKHLWRDGEIIEFPINVIYPPKKLRISHFNKLWDNMRISFLHTNLILQRIFLLKGFLR